VTRENHIRLARRRHPLMTDILRTERVVPKRWSDSGFDARYVLVTHFGTFRCRACGTVRGWPLYDQPVSTFFDPR
jgi:hypothetical protein